MCWWDQPPVPGNAPHPYGQLVEAALHQLGQLHAVLGRPVGLVASSFGVHLARSLVERAPQRVHSITVVGGIIDLRLAFVRLGLTIADATHDAGLRVLAQRAATEAPESVLFLIAALFNVPTVLDFYWGPSGVRGLRAQKLLAERGELVDATTFSTVVRDVLGRKPVQWRCQADIPVKVWIGRHDPYARPDDESRWLQWFPNAALQRVEAGHFPHLELSPAVWLPQP